MSVISIVTYPNSGAAHFAGEKAEFSEQFAAIRQAAPETTRFVLVTATVSEETYEQLSKEAFPGMKVAFGPRLHRPASGTRRVAAFVKGFSRV